MTFTGFPVLGPQLTLGEALWVPNVQCNVTLSHYIAAGERNGRGAGRGVPQCLSERISGLPQAPKHDL